MQCAHLFCNVPMTVLLFSGKFCDIWLISWAAGILLSYLHGSVETVSHNEVEAKVQKGLF